MHGRSRGPATIGALAAILAIVTVSCSDDGPPTRPTPPPTQFSPPVVTQRVEITAPGEVAPGESVQLAAHAIKNDGSREDVTARAEWLSSAAGVLDVNASGLANGRQPGEAMVRARVDVFSATIRVLVLPAGTYMLSGMTHEFGAPLPGVQIEVLDGAGAGTKTSSRHDGTYSLYGVAGSVRLHVKKDGYINALPVIHVAAHTTRDLALESMREKEAHTGTYTLTITAVAPCTGAFPDAARRRVYTASVLQRGSSLHVRLGDADFILTHGYGNAFGGTSARGVVNFDLRRFNYYYYYYAAPEYQLVERITDNTAVVVHGYGEGSGDTSRLRGRLGTISVTNRLAAPHDPFLAHCNAEFEMVRR